MLYYQGVPNKEMPVRSLHISLTAEILPSKEPKGFPSNPPSLVKVAHCAYHGLEVKPELEVLASSASVI
jgi:hypothetical protein